MRVSVVAGNPKPDSHTLEAAGLLALALTGEPAQTTIDVITLGAGLLGWGDQAVADAVAQVKASDLVIFASPTYKATYTGVLKLFLDQFETGTGLAGVVAVPFMLGGGPAHYLAPELLLKPVLVELGATVPCAGLYVSDKTYAEDGAFDRWLQQWRGPIMTLASAQE